jgi:hypothetical protein
MVWWLWLWLGVMVLTAGWGVRLDVVGRGGPRQLLSMAMAQ